MSTEPKHQWGHPETEEELIERMKYKFALSEKYIKDKGWDKWEPTEEQCEEQRLEIETYCNEYCKKNYKIK